jgi:hypothetical protein
MLRIGRAIGQMDGAFDRLDDLQEVDLRGGTRQPNPPLTPRVERRRRTSPTGRGSSP